MQPVRPNIEIHNEAQGTRVEIYCNHEAQKHTVRLWDLESASYQPLVFLSWAPWGFRETCFGSFPEADLTSLVFLSLGTALEYAECLSKSATRA